MSSIENTQEDGTRRGARSVDAAFALLALALVLWFWLTRVWWVRPAQAGDGVADVLRYYLPNLAYHVDQMRHGHWPLWNPYEFAGMPMAATLEYGPYYPLNVLFLMLPLVSAHLASGMLHTGLLAMFAFGYLRYSLRLRPAAAAIGAITVTFSGWTVQQMLRCPDEFRSAVYFPLVLWLADRVLNRPSFARASALAGACALQFLAGETEISARTVLLLVPYSLVRLLSTPLRSRRESIRLGVAYATAAALTIGLASIQLLPTYETSIRSARAPGALSYNEVTRGGVDSATELLARVIHAGGEDNPYYVGVVPIILGIAAFGSRTRRREAIFFAIAVWTLFELLRGSASWVSWLVYHLPTGSSFRAPVRYQFFLVFSVGCLGAIGMDALLARSHRRAPVRAMSKVGLIAALVAAAGSCIWFHDSALEVATATLAALALHRTRSLDGNRRNALVLRAVPALVFFTIALAGPVFYLDISAYNFPKRLSLAGLPEDVTACLDRVRAPADRVYVDATLPDGRRVPKYGPLTNTPCINGFSPFMPSAFWDEVKNQLSDLHKPASGAGGLPTMVGLWGGLSLENGASDTLNTLGVRYIVLGLGSELLRAASAPTDASGTLPESWERIHSSKSMAVYRNGLAWPRAFVVASEASSLSQGPSLIPGSRSARMESYEPERVCIDVESGESGTLVLTDQYFPGWRAYVDGVERPITPVAALFRGVNVDAAGHRIEFRYEPASWRVGAGVSMVALIVAAIGAAVSVRRQRTRSAPAAEAS